MTPGTVVVDTSALVSIITDESDAMWFAETIRAIPAPVVSAGTLQELVHVMVHRAIRSGDTPTAVTAMVGAAVQLLDILDIEVVALTKHLATLGGASSAILRATPARLNLGDGFAYALAKYLECPVLCKGEDFPRTDVAVLQPPPG